MMVLIAVVPCRTLLPSPFFHAGVSLVAPISPVFNQPQGEEGLEMRTEALSQLLPFVACPTPRVQHAALWSLERMAEDQSPGLLATYTRVLMNP